MVQTSLASHTLHITEEGSGHASTIELLPQQKLDVINQMRSLRTSHPLSWSSIYVTCLPDVSILSSTTMIIVFLGDNSIVAV